MRLRPLSVAALALVLAPSAGSGQEIPAPALAPVAACASGDPMPVGALPEGGAALPAPTPAGVPPVPIPNACEVPRGGTVQIVRGARVVGPEPLYVVDGVIRPKAENGDSPLKSIPPGSIEAITVLKDRTATAQYGADAQHGVVIVRTRKEQGVPPRP